MTAALVMAFLVSANPSVGSSSDCPSARDIESNLAVLLPGEAARPGTVWVSTAQEGLLVELRPNEPGFGAQRSVAVGDDCAERARAAAVVIATWWPVGGGAAIPAPAPPVIASPATARHRLEVSAGGYTSVVADGIAPGGRAEIAWSPGARPFGLRLALGGTAAHGATLGQGHAQWTRASAELGPAYFRGNLRADLGAVASLLLIEGSGFTVNQESSGASAGATAGLRVGWKWRRALPWLELRGLWWPQSQRIYVTDSATNLQTSHAMTHAELQLGVGVAFSAL